MMHLGNLTLQSPKNHKVEMEVSSLAGESEVGVDRELWEAPNEKQQLRTK